MARQRTVTDETAAEVVRLYKSGTKLADITAQTGVERSLLYWLLRREGVRPDRQHRRIRLDPPTIERLIELERENAELKAELRLLRLGEPLPPRPDGRTASQILQEMRDNERF